MEFQRRFDKSLTLDELKDATAQWQREVEREFNTAINQKHAAVMVPRLTIDPDHKQRNLVAASAGANWGALNWDATSTGSTTANTSQAVLTFIGRGILTKCVFAEITSGTSTVRTFSATITLDGNILYGPAAPITRESSWRVVVGNEIDVSGANFGVISTNGLPFNSSLVIEITSDGTRTFTAGWHIDKKSL